MIMHYVWVITCDGLQNHHNLKNIGFVYLSDELGERDRIKLALCSI